MDKFNWDNYVNPEVLKSNLIFGALFIATFEAFKSNIIELIKDFYTAGMIDWQEIINEDYSIQVLSKKKGDELIASLMWLKDSAAITDIDIELIKEIRKKRNTLVHEFSSTLGGGIIENYKIYYQQLIQTYSKIKKRWILEIEIPTSDIKNIDEIDSENVEDWRILALKIMYEVAMWNEKRYQELWESLKK